MDKIKSCPGCGKTPKLKEILSDPEEGPGMGYYWYQVSCECGWTGKAFRFQEAEQKAIRFWNKRI